MLATDQDLTAEIRRQIGDEALAYKRNNHLTWSEMARIFDIAQGTFIPLCGGKYTNKNRDDLLRRVDKVLSEERFELDPDIQPGFQRIRIVANAFGAFRTAIKHKSIGVLIGDPGSGKSVIARAFVEEVRPGIYHRVVSTTSTANGLLDELCVLLKIASRTRERKMRSLIEKLKGTRTYIVIDEAQKLTPSGLELVRDIHDSTEIEQAGRTWRTPFLLTGDHDFYRLILSTREGHAGGRLKPQLARRMYPVYDLARELPHIDGDGNACMYTEEEVRSIIQQRRLKLVTKDAARWLCAYANLAGFGRIGMAVAIFRMAMVTRREKNVPVDVAGLVEASRTVIGPELLQSAVNTQPLLSKSGPRKAKTA